MVSFRDGQGKTRKRAAYAFSIPAVAFGVWAGLRAAHADVQPLSLTPLQLAIALTAWYGGLGPGLFALLQAAVAVDFFFLEPGTLFRFASAGEAAAFFCSSPAGWLSVYPPTSSSAGCITTACCAPPLTARRRRRTASEQLTAALAQARTPRSAIEAAVQEPLHALKADAGMLLLTSRDGATAEVARTVAHPIGNQQLTVALSGKDPISDAVGRGAQVIIESRHARLAEHPDGVGCLAEGFEAAVDVPPLIGSRVVGVVQLDFEAPRSPRRAAGSR